MAEEIIWTPPEVSDMWSHALSFLAGAFCNVFTDQLCVQFVLILIVFYTMQGHRYKFICS